MANEPLVLLVEDQAEVAEMYRLKLQFDGYRVAIASDGLVGLQMVGSLLPDVVLLDMHLPGVSGLKVLAALRAQEATQKLPVLMLSADDSPSMVREAQRLQVSEYLIKGDVLPSRLSRAVADVLATMSASA